MSNADVDSDTSSDDQEYSTRYKLSVATRETKNLEDGTINPSSFIKILMKCGYCQTVTSVSMPFFHQPATIFNCDKLNCPYDGIPNDQGYQGFLTIEIPVVEGDTILRLDGANDHKCVGVDLTDSKWEAESKIPRKQITFDYAYEWEMNDTDYETIIGLENERPKIGGLDINIEEIV